MAAKLKQRLAGSEEGFTLIELLVVIIILAILLAIAVPSYLGFRDRAENRTAQSNARAIVPSIEAYYSDNGNYSDPGFNVGALKTTYDQSIDATKYTFLSNAASTYCLRSTQGSKNAYKNGPSAAVTSTACT
jgi:prepilin-type N-terminal cleavage/methylation domain-containing protein